MRRAQDLTWNLLRIAFALWFFSGSFVILAHALVGQPPFPEVPPQAQRLLDAFSASGYLYPLLAVCYFIGGGALFFRRTAPAGLAALAGPVAVIVGFHFLLTGMWITGTVTLLVYLLLCWRKRQRLACLWQPRAAASRI